jgi:hypothetical protein
VKTINIICLAVILIGGFVNSNAQTFQISASCPDSGYYAEILNNIQSELDEKGIIVILTSFKTIGVGENMDIIQVNGKPTMIGFEGKTFSKPFFVKDNAGYDEPLTSFQFKKVEKIHLGICMKLTAAELDTILLKSLEKVKIMAGE